MRKAIPCFECKGGGFTCEPVSSKYDLQPGTIQEYQNIVCRVCEGFKCLWVEPIKPEEPMVENDADIHTGSKGNPK